VLELGAGWQNTRASPQLMWQPAIEGSRKDVPAWLGWRYQGDSRIYYAPYARLRYTYFWSIGGAGSLLGAEVGPLGLGIYLTNPLEEAWQDQRAERWGVTLEAHVGSVQLGFDATPNAPMHDRVAGPEIQRAEAEARVRTGLATDASVQLYRLRRGTRSSTFRLP